MLIPIQAVYCLQQNVPYNPVPGCVQPATECIKRVSGVNQWLVFLLRIFSSPVVKFDRV